MNKLLERLKSIKIIRSIEPNRPTRKHQDLQLILQINRKLSTTEASKHLNEAILNLAFYAGPRISEIVNLKLENVHLDDNKIFILHGKHGKNRWLGINKELKPVLESYIKEKRPQSNEPYLFVLPSGDQLTRDRLEKRIKILTNKAKLPGGLHQFRRGCLTHYANKGVPIPHLQLIAGHSNIQTTMNYIRPDVEEVIRNQINY